MKVIIIDAIKWFPFFHISSDTSDFPSLRIEYTYVQFLTLMCILTYFENHALERDLKVSRMKQEIYSQ